MTRHESEKFYQHEYNSGFTTELPSKEELEKMKASEFENTPKDFSDRLDILHTLGVSRGDSILDFGCSWGYSSWQFMRNGLQVKGVEVSHPRAEYARKFLNVDVTTDLSDVHGGFDVFFSSHVLEHVPSVSSAISHGLSALRDGGLFIAFTPNGSLKRKQVAKDEWLSTWGLKHPNHLDEVFYKRTFQNLPYYISSSPYDLDTLKTWSQNPSQQTRDLEGGELLVVCRNE